MMDDAISTSINKQRNILGLHNHKTVFLIIIIRSNSLSILHCNIYCLYSNTECSQNNHTIANPASCALESMPHEILGIKKIFFDMLMLINIKNSKTIFFCQNSMVT